MKLNFCREKQLVDFNNSANIGTSKKIIEIIEEYKMNKHVLTLSFFLMSSSLVTVSSEGPSGLNEYEPAQREFNTYLQGLKLENISTKDALEDYIRNSLSIDYRDEAKFPVTVALVKSADRKTAEGQNKTKQTRAAILVTLEKFIEQKTSSFKQ